MKKKTNYVIKNEIINDKNEKELQENFNKKLAIIILNIKNNSIWKEDKYARKFRNSRI